VSTDNLIEPWTNVVQGLPALRGTNGLALPRHASQQFFRIQRVP
jgi:hypothetical protein